MEQMISNHHQGTKKKQYNHRRPKLMSYTCKVWSMVLVCVILVIVASALLYFLLVKSLQKPHGISHLLLPKRTEWMPKCTGDYVKVSDRFDCFPEKPDVNQYTCESRGCCFLGQAIRETINDGTPVVQCIYPENYGYKLKDEPTVTDNGFELALQRLPSPSRFGDDIPIVKVLVEKQTPYRLQIKLFDAVSDRFEVPTPKIPVSQENTHFIKNGEDTYLYNVVYNSSKVPFSLSVQRLRTGTSVFDTSAGSLIFSHHFLELSTFLPSKHLYGLGSDGTQKVGTWPLFSGLNVKQSGVHPMYVCIEDDGNAHGVLLLNSNAMEVKLSSAPAVTFRTIGGILDFYIFLGPTSEDVVRQYYEAVGPPPIPPYWTFGMHAGSDRFDPFSNIEKYVQHLQAVGMPLEVFHLGIDVVELYSANSSELQALSNLTSELHAKNQKVVIPVQPGIKVDEALNSMYKIGLKHAAFLIDKWNMPLYGKMNGQTVVYGDYGKSSCQDWWTDVLLKVFSDYLDFDGISMINNEPISEEDGGVNGCMNDDLNRPPYVPCNKVLYSQTICMDAIQHWGDEVFAHYYLHNLYGQIMASLTEKAIKVLPDVHRKLLTSHSTFIGSGHFVGHWLRGYNSWELFEPAIRTVLDYNIYGIPLVGVKVCSCEGDRELMLRWIQLSSFFPLSGFFDCSSSRLCFDEEWDHDFVRSVVLSAHQRYQLLPYLYTLFYKSHTEGSTVLRSVAHEFPNDNATYNINSQFLWGPALMISPVIKQGTKKVTYYLPQGIWYKLFMGDMIISKSEWFNETLDSMDRHNPAVLFLRARHIIVVQEPSETSIKSQQNPMRLFVALDSEFQSEGMLYWDDGVSKDSIAHGKYKLVKFRVFNNTLTVQVSTGSKGSRLNFNSAYIDLVQIMGLMENPKHVFINDYRVISKQKHWNSETKVLNIKGIVISLEGETQMKWLM